MLLTANAAVSWSTPTLTQPQAFEILEQRGILRNCRFAAGSRSANAPRGFLAGQFFHASPDRARGNPGGHCHCCNPTIAGGERLRRRNQTTAAFVEKRRDHRKRLSDGLKPPINSIKSRTGNFLTGP